MDLQDKIAIVTGGNQGIGRAAALRLSEAGATVRIAAWDERLNQQTVNYIEQVYHKKAQAFQVDVADNKSVEELVASVKKTFGHVDVLATKRCSRCHILFGF